MPNEGIGYNQLIYLRYFNDSTAVTGTGWTARENIAAWQGKIMPGRCDICRGHVEWAAPRQGNASGGAVRKFQRKISTSISKYKYK
jgi:hypothetical protein